MSQQEEIKEEEESFNRKFCEHLEWHLASTFENSENEKLRGLWCDGILDPFIDRQLTKKVLMTRGQ